MKGYILMKQCWRYGIAHFIAGKNTQDNETTTSAGKQFYPCGEGAGYAGGIVSAAMDGEGGEDDRKSSCRFSDIKKHKAICPSQPISARPELHP